jgi:hypothetical protein
MVVGPPACCGECAPTLEEPDVTALVAAKKAMIERSSIAVVEVPAVRLAPTEEIGLACRSARSRASAPLRAPLQLRL